MQGNIYLIGMMGSGKTVTGKALAKILGKTFLDLDEVLEKKTGKSVAAIFEFEGEAAFRQYESEIVAENSHLTNVVFATGGGILLREQNLALMQKTGVLVYLKTSLHWLWQRVKDFQHRPLLNQPDPKSRLEKLLMERIPLYEKAAQITVETDGKTAEQVAALIAHQLEDYEKRYR